MNNPLVSICCVTYNHENYIRQCLDGFVMQQTTFQYEILVHEDASTDSTAKILREYEAKFPHLFRCVYQTVNQFEIQNTLINILFPMARGKYIAFCDGDDYWTDPLKLQKQVDFLENNPEYVISCHDTFLIDEQGQKSSEVIIQDKDKREFSKAELMSGAFLMPVTMCFKNVLTDFPKEYFLVKNGDTFLISLLGQFGKSMFQKEILPAAYRIHSGGFWSKISEESKETARINTFFVLFSYYRRINIESQCSKIFYNKYSQSVLRLLDIQFLKGEYTAATKGYLNYIAKCFKYRELDTVFQVTKRYLALMKKRI